MALITRSIGPDAQGSKLSFAQMDNNLYFLQSIGYTGGTYENNTLILTNPTGGTIETVIESFTRNFIPSGTSITIYEDYQNLIFGDLVVQGELNIENGAELVVLNGAIIVSGGTINNSGLTYSITLPEYNTFLTGVTLDSNTKKLSFTGNFGFVPFETDLSSLSFTGGSVDNLSTNSLSATSITANTIDLCATNGTLFTDTISGCSPINILSFSNFHEGLSGSTISGGTFYGDGSNLIGISTQDIFITGGTYSDGTSTFTNNTGGTFNVTGFYTGATDVFVTGGTFSAGTATFTNNTGGTFNVTGFTSGSVGGDYLPLSGGTVTGNTFFNTLSATTISGGTLFGDGSNLTGISSGGITSAFTGNTIITPTTTNLTFNGTIIKTGTGTTIAGYVYVLNSSNGWQLTNATGTTTSSGLLGIAVGTNPQSDGMMLNGAANFTSFTGTTGTPLYLTTNDGIISEYPPSGFGYVVRIAGYKLNSSGSIYFNPDPTWIQLT